MKSARWSVFGWRQQPWATVQTAKRSLDADTIVDVPWRVPSKPDVLDVEQTADLGISVSPEGIPFKVAVELATVEPLQLAALVHDFAKTPTCLVTYKRGRKAKVPATVKSIETPTKAEPTSVPAASAVPAVLAVPVAARAMVAMAAVAAGEPVVVPPPQPYEQLLVIQREIDLLQRKAQAIRTRDFSKNIDSMRQTMQVYGISRLVRLICERHASALPGRISSRSAAKQITSWRSDMG